MKETLMILTLATQCGTFSLPFLTQLILYIFFVFLSNLVIMFPDVVTVTLLVSLVIYSYQNKLPNVTIKSITSLSNHLLTTALLGAEPCEIFLCPRHVLCPHQLVLLLLRPCFGSRFIGFLQE